MKTRRAGSTIAFINTVLLSTAFALPAMAQIEEVVVTAQKKTEDAQSVPIAVTAFTAEDLKTQQIDQAKDLQFHAPDVTYSAGNFGGVDFQIRGIGVTAIGYDSESGVAINYDEVYLAAPQLTEGSFYDLTGLEVLAGPQSTLYGRGATGGAVNINIVKPDLEQASAELNATYGNYDATKLEGAVNLPLVTDQLGLRIAGEWDRRDGFVTDTYNDSHVDGLDQYSVRTTLRWQPTERTTIDVTGQFSSEDDTHLRADKQLCTTDPTGVLGCLPGSAGTQPVNTLSNLSTIASSQQGFESFFATPLPGHPGLTVANAFLLTNAQGQAVGAELGLYNLTAGLTLPAGYVDPTGARQVVSDVTPVWKSQDNFLSLKWTQNVTHWLDSTLIFGYDRDSFFSQESYNNIEGFALPTNANNTLIAPTLTANCASSLGILPGGPNVNCAANTLLGFLSTAAGPAYAANFAPYFAHAGELPVSGVGNLGLIGGNYTYANSLTAADQSDGEASQYSAEWRFNTSFSGPLNAMLGFYYLHTSTTGDYYVTAPTLDYASIVLGGLQGLTNLPLCYTTGCIFGPGYYRNYGQANTLTSKSIFGEVYYDLIPDTVKLTAGLRFTDDQKFSSDRIELYDNLIPVGSTAESAITEPYDTEKTEFSKYTGRFVASWTPKLEFTDQTQIYASYARGYKAGGANPGIEIGNALGIPATYAPEYINAYELGTKNQILNNTLQADGDLYYYDYTGLQVSTIVDNTSVNQNINAHVWGAEGNVLWQATDRLQFGVNVAHEESNIVNESLVDQRNPTGGNPDTVLIKDDSISALTGNNCVLYETTPGVFNAASLASAGYAAPVGGYQALKSAGIANAAFGSCNSALPAPAGFSWTNASGGTPQGQPVSLNGNELQNTPNLSVGLSGQYTQPLAGDYTLAARVDLHWQSHFWERIFEDGADHVGSEEITDASLRLNSPDDVWYAQAFIKNIFNQNNITGGYLASPTSGLDTNVFYGDPRTYGLTLGAKLN